MAASTLHLHSVEDVLAWLRQQGASQLTVDSRAVASLASDGVAFIAWPGAARDGRAFVEQSLKDGARACLVEAEGLDAFGFDDARIACVTGLKAMCAEIAHGFYGEPSNILDVVAVTGTNGKTSTSWWTAQALAAVGQACGVIGTLGVGQPNGAKFVPTGLTTPDPITLHATFREFVNQGCQAAAIEASSIGIVEQRLDATRISVAQFTNFTQDHLDYHGDMDRYWQAKSALFDWPGLRAAVINLDDAMGGSLADGALARGLELWTYGLVQIARLQATGLTQHAQGMSFTLVERDAELVDTIDHVEVRTHLVGEFNASNLLAVIGALRALGVPLSQAVAACEGLTPVPGRMQQVSLPDASQALPTVVVDYAHTPDALSKVLQALRPLAAAREGRLWCVFGCGGNRDATKRPLMGAVAAQLADHVVLTSDNPRNEAPGVILSQIMAGIARREGVDVIEARDQAIAHAIQSCAKQDVIVIAGKGHETTQEMAGVKTDFSDAEHALGALFKRNQAASALMTLGMAHALLPGSVMTGHEDTLLMRAHTDTRSLQAGDLFVALKGERFDAHDFLPQACQAGAVAALVHRDLVSSGLPGLTVADTRQALGALATAWRARFDIPLIGVTGSNGKTTVTQMIASILKRWMAELVGEQAALSTQGNFNNDIGVPLTLLRLREGVHRCAVVELGMNHPGEIAQLAAMALPTVALVNNAQREHQEFMHTVEAVARENGAVMQALPADGVAVFPADDEHTPIWRELAQGHRVIDFATQGSAAVMGQMTWQSQPTPHWVIQMSTPLGEARVNLKMAGEHNVRNALAASACAVGAGVPLSAIVAGLESFEPVKGRSQLSCIEHGGHQVTLVDDSYNANPDSVRAAIDMLAGLPGPHWLVLGDMGEVGNQGPAFHEEVGSYARERGIEQVWTAGALCAHTAQAFGSQAKHFGGAADMVAAINQEQGVPVVGSILVKGSRFMKMEQVVAVLAGGAHAA